MRNNNVQMIKSAISIKDIAERYGVKVKYNGMCCCPFHGEKNPSMKLYFGNNTYHCFACGANGDIISWIMQSEKIGFVKAIKLLMDMYRLSESKVDYRDKKKSDIYNEYLSAKRKVKELQPKNTDDMPSKEFFEAIKKRNELEDKVKCLQ